MFDGVRYVQLNGLPPFTAYSRDHCVRAGLGPLLAPRRTCEQQSRVRLSSSSVLPAAEPRGCHRVLSPVQCRQARGVPRRRDGGR